MYDVELKSLLIQKILNTSRDTFTFTHIISTLILKLNKVF